MIASQPENSNAPFPGLENQNGLRQASVVKRNRIQNQATDASSELERRRGGVLLMAGIAMSAYYARRFGYDDVIVLTIEIGVGAIFAFAAFRLFVSSRKLDSKSKSDVGNRRLWIIGTSLMVACLCLPWILDSFARAFGAGNGNEILMLSGLAWGSLGIALGAATWRSLGLSVVASGFLVLFATFISENSSAVVFVYVWIAICLWWLLNNHWSTVKCLAATEVKSSPAAKWSYLFLGVGLFLAATGAAWDRIPVLRKLKAEVMRTSGGTSGKDSAARKGVGDGDALVAAKKHAASFGAVETDFFLDSEKPSLFDVFSDEFGEPKKKDRVERAQALNPDEIESNEGKFAESNRSTGGSEFSIERDPPKKKNPPKDLYSDSLMFWEGEAGVRLAANRYQLFNGTKWLKKQADESQPNNITLDAIVLEERTWFRPGSKSVQNSISPFVEAKPEALKFTRFRSFEIPVRAGTQLWSIDQITIPEFFTYTRDDCLFMPDRLHVPDYTVVRFVNSRIDQERLEGLLRNCAPGRAHKASSDACKDQLAALAHEYAGSADRGLDQVRNVIRGLRRNFKLDRNVSHEDSGALEQFLQEKKGPSYLFATAAALMLDHLGYKTRMVTGFYVNPSHYSAKEKATAILSEDAHAWVEVNSGHDYWIPLEPTPGYREPRLRAGLLYLARKNWQAIAMGTFAIVAAAVLLYCVRSFLFAVFCRLLYPVLRVIPDRKRLAWLCWMLDVRWMLIGSPRATSETQKRFFEGQRWQLEPQGREAMLNFLNTVDSVRFSRDGGLSDIERNSLHGVLGQVNRIRRVKERRTNSNENPDRADQLESQQALPAEIGAS